MKRFTITSFVFLLVSCQLLTAQSSPGAQVAERLASRLRDSLGLSSEQQQSLYQVNMSLYYRNQQVRAMHTQPDSLRFYLQRVENTRDSLYRPVLGDEKYLMYKSRKRELLRTN